MPLFRRLLGHYDDGAEKPEGSGSESGVVDNPSSVLILRRDPKSFYHNMTDEEFCTWARSWSSCSQVLTYDDRETIVERLQQYNHELSSD